MQSWRMHPLQLELQYTSTVMRIGKCKEPTNSLKRKEKNKIPGSFCMTYVGIRCNPGLAPTKATITFPTFHSSNTSHTLQSFLTSHLLTYFNKLTIPYNIKKNTVSSQLFSYILYISDQEIIIGTQLNLEILRISRPRVGNYIILYIQALPERRQM